MVVLHVLEESAPGKILGSRAGVFVIEARLHVVRKGKIQPELPGIGKGQGGADSVRVFEGDTLQGGGLGGADHSSDSKTGGDIEFGNDGNGEEEVCEDRNLVIIPNQRGLSVLRNRLAAHVQSALRRFQIVDGVHHKAGGEFEGKPVGDFSPDGAIHAEARIIGERGGPTADVRSARCAGELVDVCV